MSDQAPSEVTSYQINTLIASAEKIEQNLASMNKTQGELLQSQIRLEERQGVHDDFRHEVKEEFKGLNSKIESLSERATKTEKIVQRNAFFVSAAIGAVTIVTGAIATAVIKLVIA